ncbi:MAG TPA: NAD(P)-dependent oxidoreductase [Burkholderiaceae bacterium]|jgi:nucleoside-diphosphate-sugar epimerase
MAVLVSGASGFLGSRLVSRLAADGHDVVAVARRSAPAPFASHPRIRWIARDIAQDGLDLAGLPEIDAVVHLAGATLGAGKDESLFLRANEQTTVRLFQGLAERTDRFIIASSQVVYGDARNLAVTEDFITQPDSSAYACSKLNSENWLRWFQKRHGGQYLALRFCGFIDGGGIVDYLIDQALAGQQIELFSEGKVHRDYLPACEAIDALVAALNYSDNPGYLPINIGSGQTVSAHELAMNICTELQSSSQIKLLTKPSPQGDFVFCIDRARQLLNFQPGVLVNAVRQYAKNRQEQSRAMVSDAKKN